MRKEEIKKKLFDSVKNLPHKETVGRLSLFGSYVHGKQTEKSDIDVLVDFLPGSRITLFTLASIKNALEKELGSEVDLIPRDCLRESLREKIENDAEIAYERS